MRGVKQVKASTGRGKKHRYSAEFKVTAVKMASTQDIEVQAVATATRSCSAPFAASMNDRTASTDHRNHRSIGKDDFRL